VKMLFRALNEETIDFANLVTSPCPGKPIAS
jgi:hypothetical protein